MRVEPIDNNRIMALLGLLWSYYQRDYLNYHTQLCEYLLLIAERIRVRIDRKQHAGKVAGGRSPIGGEAVLLTRI